jgi:ABC-2 type transport system ATP-binding protein
LKIITNRIYPTDGTVLIDGLDSVENDKSQTDVFLMNDENSYPSNMTVDDMLRWTKSFYRSADIEKGRELAKRFSLETKKRFGSLSTGYATAAKFIVAIASNAKYTFLDEPVLGLDAGHRELVYKTILEEYSENPRTFVIATHIIEEVASLLENVIIIEKGKVLENDSVDNLLSTGYSVSGDEHTVNDFIKDKNVISTEKIGSVKIAYILGHKDITGSLHGLEVSGLSLQKLFVKLTEDERGE